MRKPTRDFGPGGRTLRLDEARDVVEHHDRAAAGGLRQPRAARVQRLAGALELKLELP